MDQQITLFIQSVVPRNLDLFLSTITLLGTFEITTLTLFGLLFVTWRRGKLAVSFFILFVLMHLIELSGKFFLPHFGPPPILSRFTFPIDLPTIKVVTNYSFPSGHVSRTAFLVVMAIGLFGKRLWFTLTAMFFLALMCLTRVYLGAHWASDVVGGLILGGVMGLLALVYY